MCGNGGHGQLGGGDTEGSVVPTLVRGGLQGRKVLQVAAGAGHTVCVTVEGAVFAFGCNSFGQLGFGDTDGRNVPTLLRGELENKSVMQVAAGYGHTVLVTKDGLVFACGCNDGGQLGVGDTDSRLVPTLVTGSCKAKQPCTLQQAAITRSASPQMARYFLGAAMTAVSLVLGTQRTDTRQHGLQTCKANEWCMSQLAKFTQSAAQKTALCSLGVVATMESWVLATMSPIGCCRHW